MDWASVIIAGIGGGLGAGAGVLLISILWRRKPAADGAVQKFDLRAGLVIAAAVLGMNLMPPLIEPYLSPYVRDLVARDFESEVTEMMANEPFFQVLQERAPERADAWRTAVTAAYRAGGEAEAMRVARAEGVAIGAWMTSEFGPRASDESLLAFYASLTSLTRETLMQHPRECYGFFLPNQFPGSPATPNLEALGVDPTAMAAEMIAMARTASDEPVAVDLEAAAAGQAAAIAAASDAIGPENLVLLGGRIPESDAEYRLVCQAMLVFLEHIEASDGAANTLRLMAAGG